MLSLSSCVPGMGAHFSILLLHMCCQKKTYRKSKILHPSSVTFKFGWNRSRIQPCSGSSLISWKDQGCVSFVSLYHSEMRQARRSSNRKEHPAQVIYMRIDWKFMMWNWQAAVVFSAQHPLKSQAYSQDLDPENAAYCPANRSFWDASVR